MRRTSLAEASIKELRTNIERAKRRKKHLSDYLHQLHLSYAHKKISYAHYIETLHKKTDGRTIQELIHYYDYFIQQTEKEIKKHQLHIHKGRGFNFFFLVVILSILVLSYHYFQPTLTGFFGQVPTPIETQEFTETLNLNFSISTNYEWKIENPGDLASLKISGLIELLEKNGNVKVYLDDFLILGSSDISKLKEQKKPGSSITGASIALPETGKTGDANKTITTNESIDSSSNSSSEELNQNEVLPDTANRTSPSLAQNENFELQDENPELVEEPLPSEIINESGGKIGISGSEEVPQEPPIEKEVIKFSNFCEETCDLTSFGLNKNSYTLRIEIENA